jgi:protein-L-isoaspartate(D-aspartate) O-methyltransferase
LKFAPAETPRTGAPGQSVGESASKGKFEMKIYFKNGLLALGLIFNFSCLEADPNQKANPGDKKMNRTNQTQTQLFEKKRRKMVESQIKSRGITDSLVLQALLKVERHLFVPTDFQSRAYDDRPLPIGHEQTISQPYIVAFMTGQLQLLGGEKVLEIGTGSGYQAAILAEIAGQVFSIEIVAELARESQQRLEQLGYPNIFVRAGDGYQGWPEAAPFDAIIVTAAPDHIPQPLIDQLKIGGRLIIPVGELNQELVFITKISADKIKQQRVLPVRFVPMTGEAEDKRK